MVGLVIVCHEDMGAELVRAAEMIVGRIEAVETVSVKQERAGDPPRPDSRRHKKSGPEEGRHALYRYVRGYALQHRPGLPR